MIESMNEYVIASDFKGIQIWGLNIPDGLWLIPYSGCLFIFISVRTKLSQFKGLLVFAQSLLNLLLLHGTIKSEKIPSS